MKNSLVILLCAVIISAPAYSRASGRIEITTSDEDTKYLYQLAKDTWECMDHYVSPATGFPFDTDQKPDGTNTTNIGLYLASLSVAAEMGLIPKDKALKKAEAAVDSLSKLQHWKGFFINTVNVFGDVRASEGGNAISDFNKLPAGLILVKQEFPELSQKCAMLLGRMDWSQFYDPGSKTVYGGFDVVKGEVLKWPLDLLATDSRLGVFFMVASGGAPPEVWDRLSRATEEHYGLNILKPSWYGGGIFMQGICGLFLDERQAEAGRSMADFAYAQMLFARDIDSPVWGWSSCYSPWNMYLGWGGLRGNVITPHASALAAIYYPNKVAKNLRALEKYGLRQEFDLLNAKYPFGFRDSVDIDTGQTYKGYVTALDQGMLFLSLANYLEDGIAWRLFEQDTTVKKGKRLLARYFSPNPAYINLYKKRDVEPLPERKYAGTKNPEAVIIPVKPQGRASEAEPGQIDYDITKSSRYVFSRALKSPDISPYDSLSFSIKGDKQQRFTYSLRIELEGGKNGAVYKLKGISDEWRKVTIPLREFGAKHMGWEGSNSYWGGFITDRSNIKKIDFVFDLADTSQGKGRVYLTDLSFNAIGV
ncbi:MAG: CIA30 family protein, partial [Candidatus Omnitrophica bacterium]|nr:CIA30 family protein [Candidatus Omnitrophota bacterium]